MENKDFAERLEKRTRDFAVRILRLSVKLPNTPEGRVVRNQIIKSGTSVGATIEKQTEQGAGQTLLTKSKFVRVKQAKPSFGWK